MGDQADWHCIVNVKLAAVLTAFVFLCPTDPTVVALAVAEAVPADVVLAEAG
jgi:hypothetical protein